MIWYLGGLLVGTCILCLPACSRRADAPLTFLDALFTATSALCVTGLSVRSTPNDFSFWGQLTILGLIQLGGIGIMTITTFIMAQFGGRGGLRQQAIVAETLGASAKSDLRSIVGNVVWLSVVIELAGACCLFPRFWSMMPLKNALWHSVFHSISAFCNAGFGLYDDNLVQFRGDWLVNLTIMTLIILGGIGYPVMTDVIRCISKYGIRGWDELRLHSKLTLIATIVLIFGGGLVIGMLEYDGVLEHASWSERILIPLFHSVSCRTAGFNSVDLAKLSNATLFVMILLMTVGAGACSTAGGVKVSTVSMLVLHALARVQGKKYVNAFRRTIPQSAIDRAMASVMLFLIIAVIALTALSVVEQGDYAHNIEGGLFLDAMFEVTSALGTVGLSTGITPTLSAFGKLILVLLMFFGRLGPISVFAAVTVERKRQPPHFAAEEPLVG